MKQNSFRLIWLGVTLALCILFANEALSNLENFRPVSSDDAWIMSVSYSLETRSILGSPLYAGIYNADQTWLINPPVHYILQALAFRVGGAGIAQARWVSVASALALIVTVGYLAYDWFGLSAALLAELLFVFWRSDLIASYTDLPLLAVARSARYDLSAVALIWLAIFFLNWYLKTSRWLLALALGFVAGLATLTHFFGLFVVILCAIVLGLTKGKSLLKDKSILASLVGFSGVMVPYLLYLWPHLNDLAGQTRFLGAERMQFGSVSFYAQNLSLEAERWQRYLPPQTPSAWLVAIALPALAWLAWRRERMLLSTIVVLGGLLALLDQTKAPIYALVLLPALCLLVAVFLTQLKSRLAFAPTVVIALIVVSAGIQAYQTDRQQIVSDYAALGTQLKTYLDPAATVYGTERWWWSLRDYHYLSLATLWINEALPESGSYVIVNNNVRGDVRNYAPRYQREFWNYLSACATLDADWLDGSYGQIQIYKISRCESRTGL